MKFIKKYYELLILVFLLVVLIVLMIHTLQIVRSKDEINSSALEIRVSRPDYTNVEQDDESYDVAKLLAPDAKLWQTLNERTARPYYSYLTHVFEMARCPFCNKIIPRACMERGERCPICNNSGNNGAGFVKPPLKITEKFYPTAGDRDGDGIPDEKEVEYGLDLDEPMDARRDLDNDGFSNLYEYQMETNPKLTRNHPPLWHRLTVRDIGYNELPLMLVGVDTGGVEDKGSWKVTMFDSSINRNSSRFMGSQVKLDGASYEVSDILPDPEKNSGDVLGYKVILHNSDSGENVEMRMGETLKSRKLKAFMVEYFPVKKEYAVGEGDDFSMGDRRTGMEKYRVAAIDADRMDVQLLPDRGKAADGEEMTVTRVGRIPENMRIRVEKPVEKAAEVSED